MGCSNCFNGCAEIVSDQCVKYTGIDVPVLGIQKGDSLSYVEQALIEFLTSTLDGTGIKIDIPSEIICELVQKYLPECGDITVVDLITALIKAACDLQIQVDEVKTDILLLNADYTIECLTGVTPSSNTHEIVQAIIDKLCALDVDFAAFVLDVTTNYVKKSELNSLIQAYIDSTTSAVTQQYQKMVPYTVVEYYGPLSNFDGSGAGIALLGWDKIYICNGQVVGSTVTPDKRGRIAVGAIQGVPGGALDPVIAPGGFNPNYALYGTAGANSVQLTTNQMPSHIHGAVSSVTETPHTHFVAQSTTDGGADVTSTLTVSRFYNGAGDQDYSLKGQAINANVGLTNATSTGITVGTIIGSAGNGQPHPNIPPVLACYYIMYIP
jgi:microcystin-dependent protein